MEEVEEEEEVDEDADDDDDSEVDGSEEDEWGVAVSMTSVEVPADPEGYRNSMSPCLYTESKHFNNFPWLGVCFHVCFTFIS